MSFLAIPAVPYIITGSMSLYLSYKTYSNYYQNVEYIELERDNKIKNEEELENNMKSKTENEVNFLSIDENYNVSVEQIDSETENQTSLRPPTPYPHEEIQENKLSIPASIDTPIEEVAQEIVSDIINEVLAKEEESLPPSPPPPEEMENENIKPIVTETNKVSNSPKNQKNQKNKKKRKRKKKRN